MHFEKRQRGLLWEAFPSEGEGSSDCKRRGKGRFLPLSCPQISTAYIMTSQLSALAGGLSLKKAKSYYL